MLRLTLAALLFTLLAGCGNQDYQTAEVSGAVTLDGEPLPAGSQVSFEPVATGDDITPGPASFATTDDQGHYELQMIDGARGAVVGLHRVRVSTFQTEDAEGGGWKVVVPEKAPPRYNTETELQFEVPSEGTTSADFALDTGG